MTYHMTNGALSEIRDQANLGAQFHKSTEHGQAHRRLAIMAGFMLSAIEDGLEPEESVDDLLDAIDETGSAPCYNAILREHRQVAA